MPDISMCANNKCELKNKCYRFLATPHPYWQAYADFPGGADCGYFWKIKEIKEKKVKI